jgi:Peptidase A4 family
MRELRRARTRYLRRGLQSRRRKRRLAPAAVGLSLVMVLGLFAIPGARGDGNRPCCGGGTTYEWITFYSADFGASLCVSSECTDCNNPISNGQQIELAQGVQVTISPCNIGGGVAFSQWLSNSGSLGSSTSSTTTLLPESSNSLWLIVSTYGSNNYAGYVLNYVGMIVTSASSTITIPTTVTWLQCNEPEGGACPNINIPGYGTVYNAEITSLWVGLAGDGAIWQAGIDVIAGTNELATTHYSLVAAWYEGYSNSQNSKVYLYSSIGISLGQNVNVFVSQVSSTSAYYYFDDYSTGGFIQGTISFAAPTSNAEWIAESPSYSDPVSSGYTVQPSRTSAVFSSPTASFSCSTSCPPLGNSFESAVYGDMISRTYSCGWLCTINEDDSPSELASPYSSFTS